MTTQDPPPLRIDARLLLEALSSSLAFVLTGAASVGLPAPYELIALLSIGAVIIFLNRLLGKSMTDAMTAMDNTLKQVLARSSVLEQAATPAVIRKADEAAVAVGAPPGQSTP